LREKLLQGWTFQLTRLTDEFGWEDYKAVPTRRRHHPVVGQAFGRDLVCHRRLKLAGAE
jgi:hypothetical protein